MLPLPLRAQEQPAQDQSELKQGPSQGMTAPSNMILPVAQDSGQNQEAVYRLGEVDEAYTLGPNDSIEIKVQSHSELSGVYPLNAEGKIQYEFAGDVALGGMTKKVAEDTLKKVIAEYVVTPRVILKIVEFNSKAVYVLGQVTRPGKYYMRSEVIPVLEAIIEAGMPLPDSAMHRTRLITPSKNGESVIMTVDLNALLQRGDLRNNFEMRSGDQLYIPSTQEEMEDAQRKNEDSLALAKVEETEPVSEDVRYTLGPDDVIKITVQKHPEASGTYSVNLEGKIQMDMGGDIYVSGLTAKELEEKIAKLISSYVDAPDVNVAILEYRSKVYYMLGQVTRPGKYYMRSEAIPVLEAIIEAGMPLPDSAMHRTRLITPSKNGESVIMTVDLNALLQRGDLRNNFEMRSGDQLYIPSTQEEMEDAQRKNEDSLALAKVEETEPVSEDVRYTLGPDDVIKITVQKHPEASGTYSVNLEGKIQMDMGGDIYVSGLTAKELEEKIAKLISSYVDAPDVNVAILEYRSKVYYVIGEVGTPGKFYMRSESIPVREAVVEAGLPTLAAAMRKCRLITPAKSGKAITQNVDLYSVLYGGDLDKNPEMHPGDFLYVPSTVMAKVIRVVAPVAAPVTSAAATQSGIGTLSNPLPKK
jgi:polysaccharide export outer membrane protein